MPEYGSYDVSLVGGGFESYELPRPERFGPGDFVWLALPGEDKELLVKVRKRADKTAPTRAESATFAAPGRVEMVMRNMAQGLFWEERESGPDVKLVDATLETRRGHLELRYIADRKQELRGYGARLAKLLHVKVSFVQVGARDYAKELGGQGRCGMELCCSRFLKVLPSVTLDMARKQHLFAAPDKLSGTCGRLLCCLNFELSFYEEMGELLPDVGDRVKMGEGEGRVVEVVPLKGSFRVQFEGGESRWIVAKEDADLFRVLG